MSETGVHQEPTLSTTTPDPPSGTARARVAWLEVVLAPLTGLALAALVVFWGMPDRPESVLRIAAQVIFYAVPIAMLAGLLAWATDLGTFKRARISRALVWGCRLGAGACWCLVAAHVLLSMILSNPPWPPPPLDRLEPANASWALASYERAAGVPADESVEEIYGRDEGFRDRADLVRFRFRDPSMVEALIGRFELEPASCQRVRIDLVTPWWWRERQAADGECYENIRPRSEGRWLRIDRASSTAYLMRGDF